MWGSLLVYAGLFFGLFGLGLVVRPIQWLGVGTRFHAHFVVAVGGLLTVLGLALPVSERRVVQAETRLDEFVPVWQFHEVHSLRIAAPPARVYGALRKVRADEIYLFRTLTWLRRLGRPLPPGILNAGSRESLIDVATHSSFLLLADSTPHELVIGTVVIAPPRARGRLSPRLFHDVLPSGFALAAMNFLVTPDGVGGSLVSTETRVFANSPATQRRFAVYWRFIYPGSALIRRMWLRAVQRRATNTGTR
jgi:hypothetical protein